jgi:hypothetical protein
VLEVLNIRIRSFDLDHLELSWEVPDTGANPFDYTFHVLRSEGPAGPFEPITGAFEDLYAFRDVEVNQLSQQRTYYYKIRVTRKSDSVTKDYPTTLGGAALKAQPDLAAMEISRRMKLLLQEYTGRSCWIFPIRTFGQRCDCFDPATSRRTRSQCLTCYDTGFVAGFHSPIQTNIQLDPTAQGKQMMDVAETEQENTTARLSNWPLLKARDIIIEAENRRWRVASVRSTEKLRAVVHQEASLHLIPRSDIEYRLPVDMVLSGHQPSPERQFTNPQKA